MAIIYWKESYSVGVEHLDNQHKELVKQINNLHDSMLVGKGKDSLAEILESLVKYTETHFASEENLFAKYNFPATEKHKEEHEKFVQEVQKFKEDFMNGRMMITFEVMDFLKSWLITHILGSDMEYKQFFISAGVK